MGERDDDGVGCLLIIAIAMLSFGAGSLFGGAVGCMVACASLLFLFLCGDAIKGAAIMKCEACQGRGFVLKTMTAVDGNPVRVLEPCPECNCIGIAHCCDGMREQPDGREDR